MYIWNTEKINRILENMSYTGYLIQGIRKRISYKIHKLIYTTSEKGIVVPNHHIAIISKEEFEQANDIIFGRDNRISGNKEYDIFSGHLRCGDCKNSLTKTKAKKYEYYHCSSYRRNKECTKHTTNKAELKNIVFNIVKHQIDLFTDLDYQINEIKNSISKYENLREVIKDDFENKFINHSEYLEYKSEYNTTLKNLYSEYNKVKEKLEKYIQAIDFIKKHRCDIMLQEIS